MTMTMMVLVMTMTMMVLVMTMMTTTMVLMTIMIMVMIIITIIIIIIISQVLIITRKFFVPSIRMLNTFLVTDRLLTVLIVNLQRPFTIPAWNNYQSLGGRVDFGAGGKSPLCPSTPSPRIAMTTDANKRNRQIGHGRAERIQSMRGELTTMEECSSGEREGGREGGGERESSASRCVISTPSNLHRKQTTCDPRGRETKVLSSSNGCRKNLQMRKEKKIGE